MQLKGVSLLCWVFFVHIAAVYLYTRGFLLTRLALSETHICPDGSCTLPPAYKRTVILLIDALRFDFISPNPPNPPSPYHHNILRFPGELAAAHPDRSVIFNAFADPPTATLQRIKGITTGSLPTFIDMGHNFGGSSILEDSFISQAGRAGKQMAIMGDDTWMTVFPTSFAPNMTFPYDSFNVEDLHTVDEGVIRHLFPLLRQETKTWDVIVGHFLGVDHVGHRIGPDHPVMKAKLEQMNDVLKAVVKLIDDDTLLVLLGDHGMDRKGDHGGDGELETSAGLWFYSKSRPLVNPQAVIPSLLMTEHTFIGASVPHRSVQQIDLVPSLSLLLGLPIPFNNLGTVIPELFWDDNAGDQFTHALDLNAQQIKKYLDTYRSSPSGGELDDAWPELEKAWGSSNIGDKETDQTARSLYTRFALEACRMLWAQFNVSLMGLGLTLLGVGTLAAWTLYLKLEEVKDSWEEWSEDMTRKCIPAMGLGAAGGLIAYFPLHPFMKGVGTMQLTLFGMALASSFAIIRNARPAISSIHWSSFPLPLILHAASFASNSFTFWEDRAVTFLLLTSLVPSVLTGFAAPTARLRYRILGFSALFAVCVRLMAISTVCREEQQPYCHVTFFSSSSVTSPPTLAIALAIPTAIALPWAIRRFLAISKSDRGGAVIFLQWILPLALLQSSVYWLLEWADTSELLGSEWSHLLRLCRTISAWGALSCILLGGSMLWWLAPLCIEISASTPQGSSRKKEITIIGFGNAFGSPYLIFWCISMGLVYATNQLTGQLVLGLATIALLAHLEVVDSVRDVRGLNAAFASAKPSTALNATSLRTPLLFSEIAPLALLAIHTFYSTGHQSTISSIQWKSAFMLTSTLTYPFSPALVIVNTFGPQFLLALSAPLVALWNMAPLPHPASDLHVRRGSIRAALGMMLYFSALLLGSAISSAWLRRHLMVWKVFAPRFMCAAASLLVVDLAVLIGVGVGVMRVSNRLTRTFGPLGTYQAPGKAEQNN